MPLPKPKVSPLQLEGHRVVRLLYELNPEFSGSGDKEIDYSLSVDFEVLKAEGAPLFQVPLVLKVKPARVAGPSACPVRRLEIQVDGLFRFDDEVAEQVVHTLMPANAVAILYSLARGLVSGLVAGQPGAHRLLPTVDLTNVLRAKQVQMTKRLEKESAGEK